MSSIKTEKGWQSLSKTPQHLDMLPPTANHTHTTEVAGKTLEPCTTTAIQPQGAALHNNNTATTAQAHTESHQMTSTDY